MGSQWEDKKKPHLNIVFVGHVDHGKSTTVGRLLLDTGHIEQHVVDKFEEEAKERGKHYKLVVLYDRGCYKEDRPKFRKENLYYHPDDWFSYFFEPINQTDKPLSYWKAWLDAHPDAPVMTAEDLSKSLPAGSVYIFDYGSTRSVELLWPRRDIEGFPQIWKQYFKVRPHIQQMVNDFKRKHDFRGYPLSCHNSKL
jgi:hypothetical protein